MDVSRVSGAAQRRRLRRLRAAWRHEQQSIAMALADALHHSAQPRARAEERGTYSAPRRQEPPLPTVTAGTQFFTLVDESVPVTGRPEHFWPQGKDLRRSPVHVEEPTLDVPALQMNEEWDNGFKFALLVLQQQAIAVEIPDVPVSSSIGRGLQQETVEQVLDVPVLQTMDEDHELVALVEQLIFQDIPEAQEYDLRGEGHGWLGGTLQQRADDDGVEVPAPLLDMNLVSQERVLQQRERVVDVHVPSILVPERIGEQVVDVPVQHGVHGSLSTVSGSIVEQVVDVPVPGRISSDVSESIVEQVVDVPVPGLTSSHVTERIVEQMVDVPCGDPVVQVQQSEEPPTHTAAAWLDAPQGQNHGVFRTFPQKKKSARVASHETLSLHAHSSSSTMPSYDDIDYWVDGEEVWARWDSVRGSYWWLLGTDHTQWLPPWVSRG